MTLSMILMIVAKKLSQRKVQGAGFRRSRRGSRLLHGSFRADHPAGLITFDEAREIVERLAGAGL